MAKGLRASVTKANKGRLRTNVFQPVEDERTRRLSAKLLELASSLKPNHKADMPMEVDEQAAEKPKPDGVDADVPMEDTQEVKPLNSSSEKRTLRRSHRVDKRRKEKLDLTVPLLGGKSRKSRRSKKKNR